ncbi:DUF1405 domain-containing protein [Metabacillus sp. RGM 3146]|uniref:DUF1405 domain-containing protein n=1 Tax=Metabacillus sp. RGM 3146 TaxID=3401092 RepID=UPI003B9AB6A0
MRTLLYGFGQKPVLAALFLINFLGTIYGYYWYMPQLAETPSIFLIFVPDSPTASLFFTIVLAFFLFRKNTPLFEALAIVTLFKYGIWAVVMNLLVLLVDGQLPWEGYMLICSHFGMALQGILYSPYFKFKMRHLVITGIWTLHNDVIDYVFGMMPKYYSLMSYMPQIGYFTFWLSILSLFLAYVLVIRPRTQKMELL